MLQPALPVLARRALLGLGLILASAGCEATQPRPLCRAQANTYAARYTMQGTPQGACEGKILTGEVLHLQLYRAPIADEGGTASVAIQAQSVIDALAGTMSLISAPTEYSLGKYSTVEPDPENLCKVPTLTETSVTAGTARLSYAWSNVRMLVTPASNAIHFGADLVRKDGDCTVSYQVSAAYPTVPCGDGLDSMGHPDPTVGKPNPAICDTERTKDKGLSPALSWACDASADGTSGTHLCLPNKPFPAFK